MDVRENILFSAVFSTINRYKWPALAGKCRNYGVRVSDIPALHLPRSRPSRDRWGGSGMLGAFLCREKDPFFAVRECDKKKEGFI
jgi:hypothetical protein